jgi:hypothetical protein
MRLTNLFLINAVLAIVHGVGFIFLPSTLLKLYQVSVAPGAVLMGQLFGAALVFVAIITWHARTMIDGSALSAIVLANLVADLAGTVITAKRLVDGVFGPMGWLALAIYGVLSAGYLYFQVQPAKRMG